MNRGEVEAGCPVLGGRVMKHGRYGCSMQKPPVGAGGFHVLSGRENRALV